MNVRQSSFSLRSFGILGLFGWLLLIILTAPLTVSAGGAVIYVDRDATGGTYDGTSWSTAYQTLQAALDFTNANSGTPYEIWVAAGVYYPDEGGSHTNNSVTESFRINYNNVQLYGGFAAIETLRTQRNWVANVTVLSGDIDNNDTKDANGVVVTPANIVGTNAYHVVWLDGVTTDITATTQLDGFTITAGSATSGSAPDNDGGGLYCNGSGSGNVCSPTIANVAFSGNRATNYGGAVLNNGYSSGASNPALTNVTFSGNTAPYGGAMFNQGYFGTSSPTLTDVVFRNNSASAEGGALINFGVYGVSSPVLTNVVFSGNTAPYGGAMYNHGDYGASNPTLVNVTFSNNAATTNGGAMYNNGTGGVSNPTLTNVIVWGNTAPSGAGWGVTGNSTPIVTYSDIEYGYSGTGNISADPLFVNAAGGDLSLLARSPAIDAGTNTGAPLTDIRGLTRPYNTVTDMGAYEHQGCADSQFYVNKAASGANSGKSWANAYTDLQSALQAARLCPTAEIWVAKGAYTPGLAATNVFTIPSSVALYGGFAATETLRTQRNWVANVTVLSGDIGNDDTKDANGVVVTPANINGANAYHVVWLDGVTTDITTTTQLDGFTITAGKATGSGGWETSGSGLYCNSEGSGSVCSPTIANVTFSGNTAAYGGALFNNAHFGTSSPTLTDVVFRNNSASAEGGALINFGNYGVSSPVLTNVVFSGNTAPYGGAMYNHGDYGASNPTLVNVTFSNNAATTNGGAMYNNGTGGVSNPTLTNVIVWGNTAPSGAGWGVTGNSTPIVTYSDIEYGYSGTGNISADPLFVNAAGGDLSLLARSPAIDAGAPASCPANDLRGEVRDDLRCDLGAYELTYADSPTVFRAVSSTEPTTFGSTLVGIMRDPGQTDPGVITVTKSIDWTITPTNGILAKWDITPTVTSGFSLTLQLCYATTELNGQPEGNLRFWRSSGGTLTQIGDVPAWSTINGNRCATLSGITALSRWTLATGTPNAVTLNNLDAKAAPSTSAVIGLLALLGVFALGGLWLMRKFARD